MASVGSEQAVVPVPDEMGVRALHQRGQARDEVVRFEQYARGAIGDRPFERGLSFGTQRGQGVSQVHDCQFIRWIR